MSKITKILAREILDSRGNPTIEVDVILENSILGRASVPSGASTGKFEAIELRDNDKNRFLGKGVLTAINSVNDEINSELSGFDPTNQQLIDKTLIQLDGTKNKSRLGANAILGSSLAVARAAANLNNLSLWKYLGDKNSNILPVPMMNIINGGAHANNSLDFQEIMIMPIGADSFSQAIQWGSEIFQNLKIILDKRGFSTSVGDEGGFAPEIKSIEESFNYVSEAIIKSNKSIGKEIVFAVDAAASELYKNGKYELSGLNKTLSTQEMIEYWCSLTTKFPVISIEDPLEENDFDGFSKLTSLIGKKVQIVGDDLFATNNERLLNGISKKAANSILIKVNQIGTLSETLEAIQNAKSSGFGTIISHRSGETEDCFISDLSVALNAGQIKSGSLSRSDRLSKYNQLLRIEEELGDKAKYFNLRQI